MGEHFDEGTIHAWLDGQVSPDESARIEAHISGCKECSALVAEARGYVAAASRIVGALDGVPANVLPARRSVIRPWHLRVAAVVVVMVLGTAVFLREPVPTLNFRGSTARVASSAAAPPPVAPVPAAMDSTAAHVNGQLGASALREERVGKKVERQAKADEVRKISPNSPAEPVAPASSALSAGAPGGAGGAPIDGKLETKTVPLNAPAVAGDRARNMQFERMKVTGQPAVAPPSVAPNAIIAEAAADRASGPSICAGSIVTVVTRAANDSVAAQSITVRLSGPPAGVGGSAAQAYVAPSSSAVTNGVQVQAAPLSSPTTSAARAQAAPLSNAVTYTGSWMPLGSDSATVDMTGPGGPVHARVSCRQ